MIKPLPNKKAIITMIGIVFVLLYLNAIRVQAQTAQVKNEPVQIGSSDAPIKIEVFYDMQCPSCASFHPVLKATLSKFQNKLYVTFRHFPISFHDKAFISGL